MDVDAIRGQTCTDREAEEGCGHLKGFAEHVLPFFTPQQVDDHLFAVQPAQRREMSGQQTQIIRLIVGSRRIPAVLKSFQLKPLRGLILSCKWN